MSNPYQTPESDLQDEIPTISVRINFTAVIVTALVVSGLHAWMYQISTQFTEVHALFGASLPVVTTLFMPGSVVYYVAPAMAIALVLARILGHPIEYGLLARLGAVSVLLYLATLFAMYHPIFLLNGTYNGG